MKDRLKSLRGKRPGLYFYSLGVISVFAAGFILSSLFFSTGNSKPDNFPEGFKITSPPVPNEIFIFGEKVPLENFEVYERIDREIIVNTYWHSSTILAIKRANRWFPVIEPILKENNIPVDFKYLAVAESNLENVVSPAGATGFWQFIESAAKKYKLEVNSEVDERYDVEKSTQAACDYLKDAFAQFGNWTMAAASFNAGVNGIDKWSGLQKTKNYYNMVLGSETSRYIARIIVIKLILEEPLKYGFDLKPNEFYPPLKYSEVELSSSVSDFADYANSLEINYKTLKLYNPWLRDTSLKNRSGKTYKIKVPEKGSINLIGE